ncbi:glutamyl-tRNA reductase [Aquiluna sp. KACHI24]|uniref:glutamyl-tRNA reductase n=1 Tax=Aquiluna sp. KACHI24 TaxID=2968831 RepID=UPI0021FEB62F|nr:glutamyl-tRNA reductase [Aquiluna sp. KACHI24]BDQ00789.1 glutamyl-tRNA reductase [Aquiluna sp. KACHI24]
MALAFIGTDFHDTPLADLERLERRADQIRDRLIAPDSPLSGAVVLATCNRFEVYFETEAFHGGLDFAIAQVAAELHVAPDTASSLLKVLYGPSLVQHLYAVASGLESMIVGEAEISGQVKRALTHSRSVGQTTSSLERLFQTASAVSKQVSSQTGIGASGRSIVSTALELAQQKIGNLLGKRALIIGTGAYARVVSAALKNLGLANISVFSRSGRARQFALSHELTPVTNEQLDLEMARADLVVSASGSRGFAVDLDLAQRVRLLREGNGLLFIDVSLSRDVAPEVELVPGFEIIDLETLRLKAPAEHIDAVISAQEIVREAVTEFENEQKSRAADPVIAALRAHVGLWVEQEVEAVRRKSGPEAAKDVERSLHRVTNAILHTPSVKVKDLAKDGNHDDYLNAVKLLFGLELENDERA